MHLLIYWFFFFLPCPLFSITASVSWLVMSKCKHTQRDNTKHTLEHSERQTVLGNLVWMCTHWRQHTFESFLDCPLRGECPPSHNVPASVCVSSSFMLLSSHSGSDSTQELIRVFADDGSSTWRVHFVPQVKTNCKEKTCWKQIYLELWCVVVNGWFVKYKLITWLPYLLKLQVNDLWCSPEVIT